MTLRDLLRRFCQELYNYNLFTLEEDDYIDEDDESIDPAAVVKHQQYATRLYVLLLIGKWNESMCVEYCNVNLIMRFSLQKNFQLSLEMVKPCQLPHILTFIQLFSLAFSTSTCNQQLIEFAKFCMLLASIYAIFVVGLLTPQNRAVTTSNVTPSIFKQLLLEHGNTLSCPCSTIAIRYDGFVTNNISLHPVCSSIFVSRPWVEALYLLNRSSFIPPDFRKTASSQVNWGFFRTCRRTTNSICYLDICYRS